MSTLAGLTQFLIFPFLIEGKSFSFDPGNRIWLSLFTTPLERLSDKRSKRLSRYVREAKELLLSSD